MKNYVELLNDLFTNEFLTDAQDAKKVNPLSVSFIILYCKEFFLSLISLLCSISI